MTKYLILFGVLLIVALCDNVLFADVHETYDAARKASIKDGKPLVVLVSADWCPPCIKLKRDVISILEQNNDFKDCHYVNLDVDRDLMAKPLLGNRSLPTLIKYTLGEDNIWVETSMSGYQNYQTVKNFVQ